LRQRCEGRLLLDVHLLQLPIWLLDQYRLHRHLLDGDLLTIRRHQQLRLRLLVRNHACCAAAAAVVVAGRLDKHAQLPAGAGAVARHAAVAHAAKAVLCKQQNVLTP
jgi:hypothetical protein